MISMAGVGTPIDVELADASCQRVNGRIGRGSYPRSGKVPHSRGPKRPTFGGGKPSPQIL
jgi:hypothetical protein